MSAVTFPFFRRKSPRVFNDHRDAPDALTMAPAAIAASGLWFAMLAGPLTAAYDHRIRLSTPRVEAVVSLENEPFEIAVLREASELEPQRRGND